MKAYKVIYKHGHFIDVETGVRLIPVQGAEYTISAPDKAFKSEDAKLKVGDTLSSEVKAAWAEEKFGIDKFAKIMNAGEQLFFRVGNSKRVEGDEDHQYIFLCTLFEDLYLYLLNGKKGDDAEHWRLAECKCALDSCLMGGLTLTEKIPAESLNKLFSHTVMFYFNMQRAATANVFNTFYPYHEGMDITYAGATWQRYIGLSNLRKQFVALRNKK